MKIVIRGLVVAFLAVLGFALAGCSTTNISELVKAAAADTNAVHIVVSSPWGSATIDRNTPRP